TEEILSQDGSESRHKNEIGGQCGDGVRALLELGREPKYGHPARAPSPEIGKTPGDGYQKRFAGPQGRAIGEVSDDYVARSMEGIQNRFPHPSPAGENNPHPPLSLYCRSTSVIRHGSRNGRSR